MLEIDRKIRLSWAAFSKMKDIFAVNLPMSLKFDFDNHYVPRVATYGCKTQTTSYSKGNRDENPRNQSEKQKIYQVDKKKNENSRSRATKLRWEWAGYIAQHQDR